MRQSAVMPTQNVTVNNPSFLPNKEQLMGAEDKQQYGSVMHSGKMNGGHVVDMNRQFSKSGEVRGSTISAHNINYTVKVKDKPCCGTETQKEILKNVE